MIPLERQSEYVMYKGIHKALVPISLSATTLDPVNPPSHRSPTNGIFDPSTPFSELTAFSASSPSSSLTHQPSHDVWMIILSRHQDQSRAHLQMRNTLYLHIRLHGQLMHGHTRPARFELSEPLLILAVHGREVVHGSEEDANFDDVVDGGTGFGEDGREVGEALFLGSDIIRREEEEESCVRYGTTAIRRS